MPYSRHARAATFVAFVILAAALVAPLASADHAFSHRYIIFGRVIDSAGDPVPGLTVDLGYEAPFVPESSCAAQPGTNTDAFGPTQTRPVTNDFGEFIFCFHIHAISRAAPGVGIARIESLNFEKKFDFDGYMRFSQVVLKLDSVHPEANKTILNELYTVQGRVWKPTGETKVEGIRVYGDTLHNKDVEVTVTYNGEAPITLNTTTNNYGDFSVRVPVNARPTSGTVEIKIENQTFAGSIDPTAGTTMVRGEAEGGRSPTRMLAVGGAVAFVVVLVGAAVWFTTRGTGAKLKKKKGKK